MADRALQEPAAIPGGSLRALRPVLEAIAVGAPRSETRELLDSLLREALPRLRCTIVEDAPASDSSVAVTASAVTTLVVSLDAADGTRQGVLRIECPADRSIEPEESAVIEAVRHLAVIALSRTTAAPAETISECYRAVFATTEAAYITSLDGRILDLSPAGAELFAVTREEALSRNVRSFYADAADRERMIAEIRRSGAARDLQMRMKRGDGELLDCSLSVLPWRDATGKVAGFAGIVRDVTTRRRDEAELRAAHESMHALIAASPLPIIAVDGDDVVDMWNAAAERVFGWAAADVLGARDPIGLARGNGSPTVWESARASAVGITVERTVERRDGTVVPVRISAAGLTVPGRSTPGVVAILEDVGERRKLEVELRQAQRLESIGRLAAGIAHEINTPVQFVGDSIYFLRTAFESIQPLLDAYERFAAAARCAGIVGVESDEVDAALEAADLDYLVEEIPGACQRATAGLQRVADIVRAMQVLARRERGERSSCDLNRIIESVLTAARNEYKYVADVELSLGQLPSVTCSATEIGQVVLTLVVNAAEAIGELPNARENRGTIKVHSVHEDGFVHVAVSDSGPGIPESIRDRIFEPFFTTKPVGQGTGQALAAARAIVVDRHGGSLTFDSAPGQGTTFHMKLPVKSVEEEVGT